MNDDTYPRAREVATAERAVEAAVAAYQAERASWRDAQGRPRYTPADAAYREQVALADLEGILTPAAEVAEAAEAAARRGLDEAEAAAHPLLSLSVAELQRAAWLVPLLGAAVVEHDTDALVGFLRAGVQLADRAALVAAVGPCRGLVRRLGRESRPGDSDILALAAALAEAEAILSADVDRATTGPRRELESARRLRGAIRAARNAASG